MVTGSQLLAYQRRRGLALETYTDVRSLTSALRKVDRSLAREPHSALKRIGRIMWERILRAIPVGPPEGGHWRDDVDFGAVGVKFAWVYWRTMPYSGVNEFGGSIPNPHSNPDGEPRHEFKPRNPEGYFVMPAAREARKYADPIFAADIDDIWRRAGFDVHPNAGAALS